MFNIPYTLIRKKSCLLGLLRIIHDSRRYSSAPSDSYIPVQYLQQKFGRRGGQNLSNRDLRLAKSIRQQQALTRVGQYERYALDPSLINKESYLLGGKHIPPASKAVKMFRGLAIPQKPNPPESDDCCMSGCAICVYDLYLGSLETYREDLASMRATLQRQNVPVSELPDEIVAMINGETQRQDSSIELDVSMSAFAQLEKALREKGNR